MHNLCRMSQMKNHESTPPKKPVTFYAVPSTRREQHQSINLVSIITGYERATSHRVHLLKRHGACEKKKVKHERNETLGSGWAFGRESAPTERFANEVVRTNFSLISEFISRLTLSPD